MSTVMKNQNAHSAQQPGDAPPGYHEVLYWKISGKSLRLIVMNLVGVVLLVIYGSIFFRLASTLGRLPERIEISTWVQFAIAMSTLVIVLVLHELVHGIAMRLFGAVPQYGVLWSKMMFYATSPGFAFPRGQFITIALAPLVILSLLAVLAMALLAGTAWVALLAFVATFNAAGAVGDMWIVAVVLRYPPHAYVVDEKDGVRILIPEASAPEPPSRTK